MRPAVSCCGCRGVEGPAGTGLVWREAGGGWSCRPVLIPPPVHVRPLPTGTVRPDAADFCRGRAGKVPGGSSASPANCVVSYSLSWGTERHLSLCSCGLVPAEPPQNFSSCVYFQDVEPLIFCPAQKIRIHPFHPVRELNIPSQHAMRDNSYNGWCARTAAPFI